MYYLSMLRSNALLSPFFSVPRRCHSSAICHGSKCDVSMLAGLSPPHQNMVGCAHGCLRVFVDGDAEVRRWSNVPTSLAQWEHQPIQGQFRDNDADQYERCPFGQKGSVCMVVFGWRWHGRFCELAILFVICHARQWARLGNSKNAAQNAWTWSAQVIHAHT